MTSDEQRQIIKFLPLIVNMAKVERRKFDHPLVSTQDFIQEGVIAALDALRKYDPARGPLLRRIRFKVRCRIKEYLRDDVDHLSRRHRQTGDGPALVSFERWRATDDEYFRGNAANWHHLTVNPFEPSRDDPEPSDHTFESLTACLTGKERRILHRYFIEEVPQVQIAKELHRSGPAISWRIGRAIKKIRRQYYPDNFN